MHTGLVGKTPPHSEQDNGDAAALCVQGTAMRNGGLSSSSLGRRLAASMARYGGQHWLA